MPDDRALSDLLSEFARTMVTDFPIQGILDHLVERIVEVLPITAAGVTLIAPGVEPRYVAASDEDALRYERLQTELGEGPCLAAYQTGRPISVPDVLEDVRFGAFIPRAIELGLGAVFTFPLRHGDAPALGALDLYRETPGALSPDALRAAQTLADVAAAYLLNAQARADLLEASEASREAALHDALTGLPNRTLLLERIEHAAQRRRRSGTSSALLFLDLDRFKAINDSFGHYVGDQLLVAVARRVPDVLRPGDTLARLAGDEFAVFCEDLGDLAEAHAIASRIEDALDLPFELDDSEVQTGGSIGIAFAGADDRTPEELLRDADIAMYSVKRQRDGGARARDHRALRLAEYHVDLARDLPEAMGRREFHLVYQPIVTTAEGRIVGAEALLRWTHPHRGSVPPAVLIPLAERSGLIVDIGRWVLEQARADQRRWRDESGHELAVSVNVSGHQLMAAGFAETVGAALDAPVAGPLTLEVTESVFVRDGERARGVLRDIKSLGVGLALDDFGTGYSSLSYLRRYPVDSLKIDPEFVETLGQEPTTSLIVTAIIELAHGLGMNVVAEGVETPAQLAELGRLDCDLCQGYHFARPMPPSDLDAMLRQGAELGEQTLPQ